MDARPGPGDGRDLGPKPVVGPELYSAGRVPSGGTLDLLPTPRPQCRRAAMGAVLAGVSLMRLWAGRQKAMLTRLRTGVGRSALLTPMSEMHIRARVLLPFMAVVIALIGLLGLSLIRAERRRTRDHWQQDMDRAGRLFQSDLAKDAQTLCAALEVLSVDEPIRSLFRVGDREGLLALTRPFFERLREDHRITHFYFHGADRVCFLRVHHPARHSDLIGRFTALAAERDQKTSWGIELGPLGTFTLRAVKPWYADGELIGYLELGEEIDHVIRSVKSAIEVDTVVLLDKRFLDEPSWHEGMAMLGRSMEWGLLENWVVSDHTLDYLPRQFVDALGRAAESETPVDAMSFAMPGRRLLGAVEPLNDAAQRTVGQLVLLHDMTPTDQQQRASLALVAAGCLVSCGTVFLLLHRLLGTIDARLELQTAQLGQHNQELDAEEPS